MNINQILRESFYHEGRGPELQKVYYVGNGTILKAIDYFNPDDEFIPDRMKHLLFEKPQIFMFTPEEVYNDSSDIQWHKYNNAAILCLGKSNWLESFSPRHLNRCLHYQVMFYDHYLDVICESIEAKLGSFIT